MRRLFEEATEMITEVWVATIPGWMGKAVEVFKNPSRHEMNKILSESDEGVESARFSIYKNDVYVWDWHASFHAQIMTKIVPDYTDRLDGVVSQDEDGWALSVRDPHASVYNENSKVMKYFKSVMSGEFLEVSRG